jgi:hypothetical protein
MTSPAEPETSQQYMQIARRWFTTGWTGNLAMADGIFAEDVRTNGIRVGVAGPVGRIRDGSRDSPISPRASRTCSSQAASSP